MKSTSNSLTPIKRNLFKSTLFDVTPFSAYIFNIIKGISLVLISMIILSCSEGDDGVYSNETNTDIVLSKVSYSKMEMDILDLVNDHRKKLNLSELIRMNEISSVAFEHTEYMIAEGQASHDNFEQRSQILTTNLKAQSVGENVAYGFQTAQGVFDAWIESYAHRQIIEKADYTHFGISTDSNIEGKNYFTQIFISK